MILFGAELHDSRKFDPESFGWVADRVYQPWSDESEDWSIIARPTIGG